MSAHLDWPPRAPDFSRLFEVAELKDLGWFLRKYWRFAACGAVLFAGAAFGYLHFFPPRYRSEATVRFLPPQVSGRFVNPNFSMEVEQRVFALGQLINSRLTASRLIESHHLYPERRAFQTVSDLVTRFRGDLIITQIGVGASEKTTQIPTVRISFQYPEPDKARKIVQRIVEQVFEENRKYRGDQSLGTTDFLSEQLAKAEEVMLEAEERLGDINARIQPSGRSNRTGELTQKAYALDTRLRDLRHDMRGLEERRAIRASEVAQLEAEARRVESRPADYYRAQAQNHDRRLWLEGKLDAARKAAALARERWKPDYQERVHAEQELTEAEQSYSEHLNQQIQWLRGRDREIVAGQLLRARLDLKALETEIANHKREEAELRLDLQRLNEKQSVPDSLEADALVTRREYETARQDFEALQKKHAESQAASELERRGQGETMEVIDPPSLPETPQSPTAPMIYCGASVTGAFAGLALGLLLVLRRPRILRASHVESWTGLQVLATFAGTRTDACPAPAGPKQSWRKRAAVPLLLAALFVNAGCARFSPSAEELFRQGQSAEKEGRVSAAMVFYRKAMRTDARFAPSYTAAARLALQSALPIAARDYLFRAAELLPADASIKEQLCDVIYQIYFSDPGRPATLLRELEALAADLSQRWPKRPTAYRIAAIVLMERHRGDEAQKFLEDAIARVADNGSLRLQLASLLLRRGYADGAEQELNGLIADSPAYGPAYDLLYLHLIQTRRPNEARRLLESKLENGADPDAALQLAAHADAHGDRPGAAAAIDVYLRQAKAGPLTQLRAGDFWLQRKEFALASKLYQDGAAATGRRPDYIGRLAEIELSQGRRDAALHLVESELARRPKELVLRAYVSALRLHELPPDRRIKEQQNLESILQNMPDSPFVRYHLGRAYLLGGNAGQAVEQFESCVRLDPNYAPGWLALAELEVASGNAAAGEQRADLLLRRNPNYAPALIVRARAQLLRGQSAAATNTLTRLLEVAPEDTEALYWLAQSRLQQADFQAARQLFERGEKANPADSRWVLGRANAHLRAGQSAEARKVLESALDAGRNQESLLAGLGELQLADRRPEAALATYRSLLQLPGAKLEYSLGEAGALGLAGKFEQANALYLSLQKSTPADPRPWLQHAALLAENGRSQEAIAAYRQALARAPNDPYVLNNLAWLLLQNGGEPAQALEYAQQARRIMGQSREIDDTLAAAYSRSGMYRNALAVYQSMETYLPLAERAALQPLIRSVRDKAEANKSPGGA